MERAFGEGASRGQVEHDEGPTKDGVEGLSEEGVHARPDPRRARVRESRVGRLPPQSTSKFEEIVGRLQQLAGASLYIRGTNPKLIGYEWRGRPAVFL